MGKTGETLSGLCAVAVLLATSCQSPVRTSPPSAPVVDVAMTEYSFDFTVRPKVGRVVFRARNLGRLGHELLLVSVPEDLPPVKEQLESDKRRPVGNVGRVPLREPGATGTFAVDLTAGRYAMVCFVQDGDGRQHARKGMTAEFRVR